MTGAGPMAEPPSPRTPHPVQTGGVHVTPTYGGPRDPRVSSRTRGVPPLGGSPGLNPDKWVNSHRKNHGFMSYASDNVRGLR